MADLPANDSSAQEHYGLLVADSSRPTAPVRSRHWCVAREIGQLSGRAKAHCGGMFGDPWHPGWGLYVAFYRDATLERLSPAYRSGPRTHSRCTGQWFALSAALPYSR